MQMRSQVARNPVSATNTRNLRRLLLDVLDEASTRGVVVGIGDRIKQARVEAGLTQDELGDFVGVGMRQIQYYESGESDPYRKLRQIAEATGKPISWLLRGEDQPDEDEIVERLLVVEALLRDVLRRLPEVPSEPEAGSSDLAG
jgi:transcriptional regulator with XRE-family HTH domain